MVSFLTDREKEALKLAACGLDWKQITTKLHISQASLVMCLRRARCKLEALNTTHAVAIALRKGIIQ